MECVDGPVGRTDGPFLVKQVELAIGKTGCAPYRIGERCWSRCHDLGGKNPLRMIFLAHAWRHQPRSAESVDVGDVAKAIESGLHLLEQLASSSEFQRR